MSQLSDSESVISNLPPQGAVKPFIDILKLLENRKISKVDKSFLQDQSMASGNESKFISGLRFLGLIDKDENATENMEKLSVVGEKRKENLAIIVRKAYSLLFDEVKLDFEKADSDTLVNTFKTDYKMGSINTANQGARIFVFLAQQAGISLSQQILDNLSVDQERAAKKSNTTKKTKTTKNKTESEPLQGSENKSHESLPEEAVARFTLKDVGYVDIKDKDTFELAKAYMKVLSKKLGIDET